MVPTPMIPPSHYANVVTEERPGGTRMPLLNADMSVVRHKQYHDNKSAIEATRRRIRSDTSGAKD